MHINNLVVELRSTTYKFEYKFVIFEDLLPLKVRVQFILHYINIIF